MTMSGFRKLGVGGYGGVHSSVFVDSGPLDLGISFLSTWEPQL